MVIHYQPGRLRRNSDQPTAITHALVATSGSSSRTGDIPLGIPTCSARSRHGLWALYPSGAEVVVFLTDPDGQDGTSWPATWPRTWSSPAIGYWLSGPTNQRGHGDYKPSSWPGAPTIQPRPLRPPAALPGGTPRRAQPDPSQSPEPAPQRAA